VIYLVNFLVAYPLTDTQIAEWARCIIHLRPETTSDELQNIMNKFITAEYDYDTRKGIQNIFKHLPVKVKTPDYQAFLNGNV